MGPVWVDMFYTWQADGKMNPKMKLSLPSPGLPGQPMYYVIPAKAANAAIAKKFIDFAESPEVQADGIVKQFNWYPGIDPQYVQAKMEPAAYNKLFTDISPQDLSEVRPSVPAVRVLHGHRRRVRARRAEVSRCKRARRPRPAAGMTRRGPFGCRRPSRRLARPLDGARSEATARRAADAPPGAGFALVAPVRCAVVVLFFVLPLGRCPRSARSGRRRRLHARAFRQGARPLHARISSFTVGDRRCCRRSLIALVAIAIAGYLTLGENPRAVAVLRWLYRWPLFIPFVVARAGDAHVPRQERHAEPRADRHGAARAARGAERARLARHRGRVRLEAGAVRHAAAGGRDGVARPHARRGGAQPRRAALARARRHRAAAGARHAAGRARAVVRDDALGAVRAADDQPQLADDDHRRRGVPHQHASATTPSRMRCA